MNEYNFKKLKREFQGKDNSNSSILLLTILTLIALLMTWASTTEIDNVTRGSGKVVSMAKNQLVQSSEVGVLRSRYVEEGQTVKKGDILFDIDPVETKTQLDQAQKRFSTLQIKATRLKAEVNSQVPSFSQNEISSNNETVAIELALYDSRKNDLENQLDILAQRKEQRINQIEEYEIDRNVAAQSLNLVKSEIETLKPLVRSGLAPQTRLIALQREEQNNVGTIEQSQIAIKRTESTLTELDQQVTAARQTYITTALTELSSVEAELSELLARIPALEQRLERTSIKSPSDGIVNQIKFTTDEAYVNKGDILLEIVPTGSDIIVEAAIDPKDIADIAVNQKVKISLSAFDPLRYGRIDGKVLNISADSVSDKNQGGDYYSVDVSMENTLYEANGEEIKIIPGMVATIDVLSGKRTVLQYFWAPVARIKERAFVD